MVCSRDPGFSLKTVLQSYILRFSKKKKKSYILLSTFYNENIEKWLKVLIRQLVENLFFNERKSC
jgi:hypothetical protein